MRQVVAYRGLKKHSKIFNRQGQKVYTEEVVVYKGFNCKALTGKILVFWIGGRLWETVAYES